jgi:hypothetical protein
MLTLSDLPLQLSGLPHCRAFVSVWQQWRGDRLLPTRADVRPEMLGLALSALAVLEVVTPDEIVIRLVSSQAEAFWGVSMKGRNYVDLVRPEDRAERIERHQRLINTPCGALTATHLVAKNQLVVAVRAVILPVAPQPGATPTFLYIATDFQPGRDLAKSTTHAAPLAGGFDYVDIGFGVPAMVG